MIAARAAPPSATEPASACRFDAQPVPDTLDAAGFLRDVTRFVGNLLRGHLTAQSYDARHGGNVDVAALGQVVLMQGGLYLRRDSSIFRRCRGAVVSVDGGMANARTGVFGILSCLVKRLAGRLRKHRPD